MAVEELGVKFVVEGFGKLDAQLDKVNKSLDDIAGTSAKSASIMNNTIAVAMGEVLVNAAEFAINAVVGLGVAMVDTLKESTQLAIDFESSMTELSIAVGKTGPPFQDLKDAAIAVGGASDLVGVSASGAAEAMTNLYKAGLSTEQIFGDFNATLENGNQLSGALRASIDLAAASELDMGQASELAAVALATFGSELETDEEKANFIRSAMDNFIKSADASVASVSGLADALKNVGPTAASFGFSLEETNTALAILSTRGIEGGEAGTALKSMMTNLMRPTDAVKGKMQELGVSLFNVDGTMKDLPTIIDEFSAALYGARDVTVEVGGRTKEQNAELDRLRKLYASTQKSISDYTTGINGASMSEEARNRKLADLQVKLGNIRNEMGVLEGVQGKLTTSTVTLTEQQRLEAIQTLAGTFGMKAFSTLLEEGTDGWNKMSEAVDNAAGIQEQATAKAQTFAGRMEALDGVVETLKIQVGDAILTAFSPMLNTFIGFAENIGPGMVQAFAEITSTVSPFIQEVADLVNWLVKTGETGDRMNAKFFALDGSTRNFINTIIEFGKNAKQFLQDALEKARPGLERMAVVVVELAGKVQEFVQNALAKFGAWFEENRPLIMDFIGVMSDAFAFIAEVVNEAWDVIGPIIMGIIDIVLEMAELIMNIATGDWDAAWENFFNIVAQAGYAIAQAVIELWDVVVKIFTDGGKAVLDGIFGFVKSIVDAWYWLANTLVGNSIIPDMLNAITQLFSNFAAAFIQALNNFTRMIQDVFTLMAEWIQRNLEALQLFWGDIWSAIEENTIAILDAIYDFVITTIQGLYDSITAKIAELQAWWSETWQAISDALVGEEGILTKLVTAAKVKAQEILGAITAGISGIGQWLIDNADTIIQYGKDLVAGIVKGITDTADGIGTAITGAIESINLLAGDALETLKSIGSSIIDGLKQGLEASTGIIDGIISAINSVIGDEGVGTAITNLGTAIASALSGALGGLSDVASSIANIVIGAFNDAIEAINEMFSDVGLPIEIPNIPEFQAGVMGFGGGLAMVGESGPEIVNLPAGSDVFPSSRIGATVTMLDMISDAVRGAISDIPRQTIIINNYNNEGDRSYNLTTNSITRPGGLALEFETMSMVSR